MRSQTRVTCSGCGVALPAAASEGERCPACQQALVEAFRQRPPLPLGTTLQQGGLRVVSTIGFGGSGIIYAADEVGLDTRVAIKEVFPIGCVREGTEVVARGRGNSKNLRSCQEHARNEVSVLTFFDHPGIVKVHGLFQENGTVYTIMELLRGRTLQQMSRLKGDAFPLDELLDCAGQAAAALGALHRRGLMHGDVKPENLFVTTAGRTVLIDFGAAANFKLGHPRTKEMTPAYAPPEQYPRSRHREGPYTDIYGLGATLYQLLSNQLPPPASARLRHQRLEPLASLRADAGEQVCAAVETALNLEPSARHDSMETFATLLGAPAGHRTTAHTFEQSWLLKGHLSPIRGLVASADGRLVSVAAQSGMTLVLLAADHEQNKRVRLRGPLSCLALNRAGTRVVTGGEDGAVKLWNLQGEELGCLVKRGRVGGVAFANDSAYVAAGMMDGTTLVWNSSGATHTCLEKHESMVRCVAFSPDSRLLATGSHDCQAAIWDLATGRCLHRLQGHDQTVYSLAFSPDGRLLATGGHDNLVCLWLVETGRRLRTLRGHANAVYGVAFSGDSKHVASGSLDGSVAVYEVQVGRRLASESKDKEVRGLVWLPNGMLVSTSEDGTLRGWSLRSG